MSDDGEAAIAREVAEAQADEERRADNRRKNIGRNPN